MNVSVIVPAAGQSTRFGESDKLIQDLGGRPLLIRTIELLSKREEVNQILVGAPPEDLEQFRERFAATLGFLGATVVEGGRVDRWETVQNALHHVSPDATHIAVHDAARPGVSMALLDRLFEAARSKAAVVPGVRINSTVKRVSSESETVRAIEEDGVADAILGEVGRVEIETLKVLETVSREDLMEIQTPQIFDADLFRRAYAQEDLSGTDDAMLVERLGESVYVVEGDVGNLKVTTPSDLTLIRAVMGVRGPEKRPVHKQF
ncbi:MAG: 2-C-methyl-D-erythritol 4-phosphate cytidylyltransferase [Planctomycetota bacterium]|nr:2-C-methyl-D-erythritol 4-phosphate cytidylyltransferase [Planctomycetota bacterium]